MLESFNLHGNGDSGKTAVTTAAMETTSTIIQLLFHPQRPIIEEENLSPCNSILHAARSNFVPFIVSWVSELESGITNESFL
jgi:hypothetical protein